MPFFRIKDLRSSAGTNAADEQFSEFNVASFQWVQNRQGFYWPLDEVHRRLEVIIHREFNAIYEVMAEKQINMRTAAYVHALNRISEAIEAGGTRRYFSDET